MTSNLRSVMTASISVIWGMKDLMLKIPTLKRHKKEDSSPLNLLRKNGTQLRCIIIYNLTFEKRHLDNIEYVYTLNPKTHKVSKFSIQAYDR